MRTLLLLCAALAGVAALADVAAFGAEVSEVSEVRAADAALSAVRPSVSAVAGANAVRVCDLADAPSASCPVPALDAVAESGGPVVPPAGVDEIRTVSSDSCPSLPSFGAAASDGGGRIAVRETAVIAGAAEAEVRPQRLPLQAAREGETCDLARSCFGGRFLSGPWSVLRRLRAARRRGDASEASRMEALLGDALADALLLEEEPQQ